MLHTIVQQRFLRSGEKYYICFVDNSFSFPTVKNIQNRLVKLLQKFGTTFFYETQCTLRCDPLRIRVRPRKVFVKNLYSPDNYIYRITGPKIGRKVHLVLPDGIKIPRKNTKPS